MTQLHYTADVVQPNSGYNAYVCVYYVKITLLRSFLLVESVE